MLLQMATTAQAIMTNRASVIQPTWAPSTWFRMPYSPLKIQRHTMVTAAGAQTMGRKKMVRKPPLNLILAFSSMATSRDRNRPTGTVRIQNRMVFQVAFQNSGVWKISA
jgi:hypothetical protein